MNEALFYFGFLGATGISALALIIVIWVRSGKGVPGWLMAASTIPVFIAIATLVGLVISRYYGRYWTGEAFGAVVFALLTVSAILFTIGFVWDRVERRNEEQ